MIIWKKKIPKILKNYLQNAKLFLKVKFLCSLHEKELYDSHQVILLFIFLSINENLLAQYHFKLIHF